MSRILTRWKASKFGGKARVISYHLFYMCFTKLSRVVAAFCSLVQLHDIIKLVEQYDVL